MTVILKPRCSSVSRRWQHKSLISSENHLEEAKEDSNYTVILGSHRNSRLKIEKDGELCHLASEVPGCRLNGSDFNKFWIDLDGSSIRIGIGEPAPENLCCQWEDRVPIKNIRCIGLSAWDKHVAYRDVRLHPSIDFHRNKADIFRDEIIAPSFAPLQPIPSLSMISSRCLRENLSTTSVCAILEFVSCIRPIADKLRVHALNYLVHNFSTVVFDDPLGFRGLNVLDLGEVIENQRLNATSEKDIFDALILWSEGRRLDEIEHLLPSIRFPQMSFDELQAVSKVSLMSESSVLRELVREALDVNINESQQSSIGPGTIRAVGLVRQPTPAEVAAMTRFQRRNVHGSTQLMFIFDGDHNGVFWYLGTRCRTLPWMNPAVLGLVKARASSPVSRGTDPKSLVGRSFARTNVAGPRRENDCLVAWWEVDLGENNSLVCNYYTLRHDGSTEFLRNWVLQGSTDGKSWVVLRRHIGDSSLKLPGQLASWPVVGAHASFPYRYFRIFRSIAETEGRPLENKYGDGMLPVSPPGTPPQRSINDAMDATTNGMRICLSNIELYGSLVYQCKK